MTDARSLITVFHELNKSESKTVAHFTPSLIGMFGSIGIFDSFLNEIEAAIVSHQVSASLKKRVANLIGTFIPQVAEFNSIKDPASRPVNADELRNIAADSLENRRVGIAIILSALIAILKEAENIS